MADRGPAGKYYGLGFFTQPPPGPIPTIVSLDVATEVDVAQPIQGTKVATLTPAIEVDVAGAVLWVRTTVVPVTPATEVDVAQPIVYVPPTITILTPAIEVDIAGDIYSMAPQDTYVSVGAATEADLARPIIYIPPPPPPLPPLPDTLFVDGVDLQAIPGLIVTDISGLFAPGTRRGGDDVIPGRRGQIGAELPFDAYAFTIPVALLSDTAGGIIAESPAAGRAQFLANLRQLSAALMGVNGLVTLTRRLTAPEGGSVEHTAAGRFVSGTAFAMLNPDTGRTELQFVNLDGAWFDGSGWIVP